MVGVVGKSKACHDCRRRRVKCDLRRPTCSRCEKAKLLCQGYDRDPIFVNRTFAEPSTNAHTAILTARLQRRRTPSVDQSWNWDQELQRLTTERFRGSYSHTEYRLRAWWLLKDLYLPKASTASPGNLGEPSPYTWLPAACSLKGKNDALDYSLATFCAIQLHVTDGTKAFRDVEMQLYSRALQELVKDLAHMERLSNEVLAAIVAISTCEIFLLPTDRSWTVHAKGISQILQDDRFLGDISSTCGSLCSRLRIVCVIMGLTNRRGLMLGADKWKQFIHKARMPNKFETMMDLLSEVPQLMEEAETALVNEDDPTSIQKLSLLQSLLMAAQRLQTWHENYKSNLSQPSCWVVPSKLHNPSDDIYGNNLFPFALRFPSLDVAMPLCLTAGVTLQILDMMMRLNPTLASAETPVTALTTDMTIFDPPTMANVASLANKLARFCSQTLEFSYQIEMGTLGAQATWHMQWCLRRYYQMAGLERELEWVKSVKKMTGPNHRFNIKFMFVEKD